MKYTEEQIATVRTAMADIPEYMELSPEVEQFLRAETRYIAEQILKALHDAGELR